MDGDICRLGHWSHVSVGKVEMCNGKVPQCCMVNKCRKQCVGRRAVGKCVGVPECEVAV